MALALIDVRARRIRLRNLPPGLFMFGATLGFKSEYRGVDADDPGDAYVVETGEYFWGGTSTQRDRGDLLVTPAFWFFPADNRPSVARSAAGNPARDDQNPFPPRGEDQSNLPTESTGEEHGR